MVAYSFQSQQYQPQYGGAGGLPPGQKYKGAIVDSRQEPTADGRGGFLAFDIQVVEGPLAGQKQTDRLNLHNVNPKTVEIANKQLAAYCHVTGVFQFTDTAQLHNRPFLFDVRQQKNDAQYTEICALYDLNGNEPGKASAGGPAPQQQPPANTPPPAGVAPQGGGWGGQPAATGPENGPPPPGGPAPAQGGWGGAPAPSGGPAAASGGWGGAPAPQGGPAPQQGWQQGQPPQQGGWGQR